MVTINLTLLVETGLFLIFLWMMHRFVFRPILRTMDDRDRRLETDQSEAQRLEAEARSLEREYKQRVAEIHRDASHRILSMQRQAQEEHLAGIDALKKREVEELNRVRKEARGQIESERVHFPAIAEDLQHLMAEKLGLERKSA